MPYRPRSEREGSRVRAAATATGPALDAALTQIGIAFDEAAAINGFKLRIERLLRLGPRHPAVQARFGQRAALLAARNLGVAIAAVERGWRDERKAFQIASALGCGNRLSLEILRELRLVLRLMRFCRRHAEFTAIVAALRDPTIREAAE